MLARMCRKTFQIHTPRKKGPGNIDTMVHENTKILTFSEVYLYVAYRNENVLPMQYTEICLALKLEEKIF